MITVTVCTYEKGFKEYLVYEIPNINGVHTLPSRANYLEQIHFIVAQNHVVVADDEDLHLYVNNPGRVKFDGEEVVNDKVDIG